MIYQVVKNFDNTIRITVIVLFLLVSFCLTTYSFIDYDFGWHIQLGNYILLHGIPTTDPFSYTMPNYPLIDHEWLIDILLAAVYPKIGFLALSIIFSSIVCIPFIILACRYWGRAAIPLLLLMGGAILDFVGVRYQVIDWVFAEVFFLLFLSPATWKQCRYLVPLLLLLWTNLHGGFAIGLFFVSIYIVICSLQTKKIDIHNFIVFVLCFVTTCINPYGIYIWRVIFDSLADPSLHMRILEWMPSFYFLNIFLWCYITLSLFFFIRYIKQQTFQDIIFYSILLIMALSAYRYVPFWLLYSFPVTIRSFRIFVREIHAFHLGTERLHVIYRLSLAFIGMLWVIMYIPLLPIKQPDAFYPKNTILYLKTHPFNGELFAPYEWGGYLLWQFPQKKVFIDGLMPSWHWQNPDKQLSNDAFAEYEEVLQGKMPLQDILAKYHITRILIFKDMFDTNSGQTKHISLKESPKNTKNLQIFTSELQAEGMKQLYQDDVAVIYGK